MEFLSGDAYARRSFIKYKVFFFCVCVFLFSGSVVGTSGLAPSPTSGGLFLPVIGKI